MSDPNLQPIDPLRAAQIKTIFVEAASLSPPERESFLSERCGEDAAQRRAVESLLKAHDQAIGFMDSPTSTRASDSAIVGSSVASLKQIGPYKILQEIGEGGFGTVYLAEQEQPVRRRVALKVIKAGMDSRQVIARFEAERQALAMMEHPNIARVLDAGATDHGLPYFVMELVKGVPITQYCDEKRLTPRQRLELFIPVCQAVQHAHQKGIIHRDIKPSNVLVTSHDGVAIAKVIDFGIAKATQSRLTEKTLFTEFRQMIGTPEYMSPEQAEMSGFDIDTRSDVYSLGVLLYELLTGLTPFDGKELRSKAFGEMQRIIREVDPPAPSTRLSGSDKMPSIAATRSVDPGKLASTIRGELDWIAMKCLEKDRTRRYESASALASDVSRYLSDEVVFASPVSSMYRLRKAVKRNKRLVTAVTLLLLVLTAGIIGTTIGLIGESRQRAEAEKQTKQAVEQSEIAEAVSRFQSDMLSSADPDRMLTDRVTVLQVMQAAEKELEGGKLKDRPMVEAAVRNTLGSTLHALGRFEDAERNLRRAVELIQMAKPTAGEALSNTYTLLGLTLYSQGRFVEAEEPYQKALKIGQVRLAADHDDRATQLNNLAMLYYARGEFIKAEPLFRDALDIYRKTEKGRLKLATGLNNFALFLSSQGKPSEAEKVYREALSIDQQLLPAGHPESATRMTNLASLLQDNGQPDEAEQLAQQALAIFRQHLPADHPNIAKALLVLGFQRLREKRFPESEIFFREALVIHRKSLPPEHRDVATMAYNLATVVRAQKKYPEAELLMREALAIYQKSLSPENENVISSRITLAAILREQLRFEEAERELLEAERVSRAAPAGPMNRHQNCIRSLIRLYESWHEAHPEKGYAARAEEWKSKLPATSMPNTTSSRPQ